MRTVAFAGNVIKVGTPVTGRDGAEVGTVASTQGSDLVIDLKDGDRLTVSEHRVAAVGQELVVLDQDTAPARQSSDGTAERWQRARVAAAEVALTASKRTGRPVSRRVAELLERQTAS